MSRLEYTIRLVTLIACVTLLPAWLIFCLGVPTVPAVLGSVALRTLLGVLWTDDKPER